MKRIALLYFFALFAVVSHADEYKVEGFPTIFSDYADYYRSLCQLDEFEEGTMLYNMAVENYNRYYEYRRDLNNWMTLYRMADGTYTKKRCFIEWDDSIVDGHTYSKLIVGDKNTKLSFGDKDTLLYRQEGKKVFLHQRNGQELLLMNFGLEIGDCFTNPQGKKFIVKEKKAYDAGLFTLSWKREGETADPIQLRLISENGNEEDIWIEGIGSIYSHILPLYQTGGLTAFDNVPVWSKVFAMTSISGVAIAEVDEEDYKLCWFPIDYHARTYDRFDFSFIGDTLMVKGFISPKVPTGYVECCIKGDRIDVEANQYVNTCIFPTSSLKRYFEAKVPGFKAGTYQVGLKGEEHVTLECKGRENVTNDILTIEPWNGSNDMQYDKYWYVRYRHQDGTAQSMQYGIVKGDSVVMGKKYQRIQFSEIPMSNEGSALKYYAPEHVYVNDTLLYRQEGNRVYCLLPGQREEIAVLDYGMEMGDVFTMPDGKQLRVEETGHFEDCWNEWSTPSPHEVRMLRLRSESDNHEDVWIEGIGSTSWGILPPCLTEGLRSVSNRPVTTQVYVASSKWVGTEKTTLRALDYMNVVNEENYKFIPFTHDGVKRNENDIFWNPSFHGDTLCIVGTLEIPSINWPGYFECLITEDNTIAMATGGLHAPYSPFDLVNVEINVPGFQPGTYTLYTKALTCLGTDDIKAVQSESTGRFSINYSCYDLCGRRTENPMSGIYIRNGKKYIIR